MCKPNIMEIRLAKFLARGGIASRRKAEKIIESERVTVNGAVITDPAYGVNPVKDAVFCDDKRVTLPEEHVYYAVYKPQGYVSTVEDPNAEKKVVDLVPSIHRIFPIGRLDKDSEGLMILTDDGNLTLKMTHPRYEHEKEYRVEATARHRLNKKKAGKMMQKLSRGIELEDGVTKPCLVNMASVDGNLVVFDMILKEGRKRQIRRMCREVGLKVKRLVRTRMGKYVMKNMNPGEYRRINKDEII